MSVNILDDKFYRQIDNPKERLAIITTDYTENDQNWERMEKDFHNIKTMLANLGFSEENIKTLGKPPIAKNVILHEATMHCTSECENRNGYILMFNLTYKRHLNEYRAHTTWYDSEYIRNIFVTNSLLQWATKPKLIFYQTPSIPIIKSDKSPSYTVTDSNSSNTFAYPIDADIFESFSCAGDKDSYGDANGSFYIQALCNVINQRIADGSIENKCIDLIMCDVHAKIDEMVMEAGHAASQAPYYKSTFVKKFLFPV